MNYDDILKLKDRDAIDRIGGKVTGIYAKDATDKQKAAGIEPQDVVLQDENGAKLRLRINSKNMHLPQSARGRNFVFESTSNEAGQPSGLSKNVYNNVHTVNVNKDAVFQGDKSVAFEPAQDRKNPNPLKEVVMDAPRVDINDHIEALCGILDKVTYKLENVPLFNGEDGRDLVFRFATSIYIQACKDNLITKSEAASSPTTTVSTPAGPLPKVDPTDWEAQYATLEARLVTEGHELDDVTSVFDDLKAHFVKRTKNFNNAEFCKVILQDVDSFIGAVETALNARSEPKPVTVKGDDIPF